MFYTSIRIGKDGKPFKMYKIRTLVHGSDRSSFAGKDSYTRFGKFLRKYKLDEFPQIINVIRGDMRVFGYRPEESRTWNILPQSVRDTLMEQKPGIIDLASLHFFDEEEILQQSTDMTSDYYMKVKPLKIFLQVFYIKNRSILLNMAIIWLAIKRIITRR